MGLSTIYLLKYSNYYNRIVRKENSLEAYLEYQVGTAIQRVNFNPNDYIDTELIVNWDSAEIPNYLLAVDEIGEISCWFVVDIQRTRAGQHRFILHRDLVADYRDEVLTSMAYIRRAQLPPSNKLIYNSEGLSFNQIKTREDLLYDKTKTPWIVGYMDPTAADLQGATIDFEGNDAPLTNYQELLDLSTKPVKVIEKDPTVQFYVVLSANEATKQQEDVTIRLYSFHPSFSQGFGSAMTIKSWNWPSLLEYLDPATSHAYRQLDNDSGPGKFLPAFVNQAAAINNLVATNIEGTTDKNPYLNLNGKVVLDPSTSKYYKIKVTQGETKATTVQCSNFSNEPYDPKYPAMFEYINNLIMGTGLVRHWGILGDFYGSARERITVIYRETTYSLALEPVQYGNYSVTLNPSARVLQDAPYRMFAMKYTPQNYMLAINLATNNGSKMYDVQLLPYCPVQDYFDDDGNIKWTNTMVEHRDYEKITSGPSSTTPLDYLFWATNSIGTFDIEYIVNIENIKQECECDLYRLCSPNGNGNFEFNAARNGGILSINVDYSYRPFDPYIHLNPNFGELYGQDFNDFRGLVLNGDFSIPLINDQWTQYTIQNKNYQNIFNREIQSLELQNKIAGKQDIVNAITGSLGGGISGAMAGSLAGPYGAAAGAIGGTLGSAIGGGLDVHYNRILRQDQLNLQKDLFTYNLQNIQALPQSVSKTGCLTNNNKLVPYIEYYTCTDEEKQVLATKIKYTGMTVGTTGLISDYVVLGNGVEDAQYIEADIIFIETNEDYHMLTEIAKELQGGVRFA